MGRTERPINVTIVGEITEIHQKSWAERLTIILEMQYGVEGCRQILEELKKSKEDIWEKDIYNIMDREDMKSQM